MHVMSPPTNRKNLTKMHIYEEYQPFDIHNELNTLTEILLSVKICRENKKKLK